MADLGYPAALVLTLTVEVPVYVLGLSAGAAVPWRRAAMVAVVVNVVSHPLLWFGLVPLLTRVTGSELTALIIAELVVWVGESVATARLAARPIGLGLAVAAAANAASLLAGVVLAQAFASR